MWAVVAAMLEELAVEQEAGHRPGRVHVLEAEAAPLVALMSAAAVALACPQ